MIKRINNNSVRICCGSNGCPEVRKIDENTYEITDDDGNKIKITEAELKLMGDAAVVLDDKQLICG